MHGFCAKNVRNIFVRIFKIDVYRQRAPPPSPRIWGRPPLPPQFPPRCNAVALSRRPEPADAIANGYQTKTTLLRVPVLFSAQYGHLASICQTPSITNLYSCSPAGR